MTNTSSDGVCARKKRGGTECFSATGRGMVCWDGLLWQERACGVRSNLTPKYDPLADAPYGYLRSVELTVDTFRPRAAAANALQFIAHYSRKIWATRPASWPKPKRPVVFWPAGDPDNDLYGQHWPREGPDQLAELHGWEPFISREHGLCDRMCPEHRRHCDAYGDGSERNYGHVGPHACANCDDWRPR